MRMIRREASRHILSMSEKYPVVIVTGPYHSGKTTLIRRLFPEHAYVNLADEEPRDLARRRPFDFFKLYGGDVIIDEFRLAPELAGAIRAAVAGSKRRGQFILVSSQRAHGPAVAPAPQNKLGAVTLLPLTVGEIFKSGVRLNRDDYIHRGFMPRAYGVGKGVSVAQAALQRRDYFAGYIDRYIRRLIVTGSDYALRHFLRLIAQRVGQAVNIDTYAVEAGVSTRTAASWVAALEAGFVIFPLPCYSAVLGERVMRSPKYYFTDVGLAAHLLGIESPAQLHRDPRIGNLFENMVVADALKCCRNKGRISELYYFRSQAGLEIDLVVKKGRRVIPVEIKCGDSFRTSYSANIGRFREMSDKIENGYVIYGGENSVREDGTTYLNYRDMKKVFGRVKKVKS